MKCVVFQSLHVLFSYEYWHNAGNNSARILVEYRENVGNNSGRISAQNSGGIPGECQQ